MTADDPPVSMPAGRRADRAPEVVAAGVRRDGWAVVPAALSPAECDELIAVLERRRWRADGTGLLGWVTDARWPRLLERVVGPAPRLLREQLVTKAPATPAEVPWHQDAGYAPDDGEFATCFVALGPISEANGCLWMASGSHRWGPAEHVRAGNYLTVAVPPSDPGVPVPLARGDAVVFTSCTLHRSGGNATPGTRPAWMIQFAAP